MPASNSLTDCLFTQLIILFQYIDSLARITRYLPFLRRKTDVMIHVRMWELRKVHIMADTYQMDVFIAIKSRNEFFELLGNGIASIVYLDKQSYYE